MALAFRLHWAGLPEMEAGAWVQTFLDCCPRKEDDRAFPWDEGMKITRWIYTLKRSRSGEQQTSAPAPGLGANGSEPSCPAAER